MKYGHSVRTNYNFKCSLCTGDEMVSNSVILSQPKEQWSIIHRETC